MIGAVLTSAAYHLAQLVIGRVILGFGVGLATQSVPVYLSEMAPTHIRGMLNIMFQLSITIGILIAELINLGERYCHECSAGVARCGPYLPFNATAALYKHHVSMRYGQPLEMGEKVL